MKDRPCESCARQTGFGRVFGWGTFLGVLLTGGLWLVAMPFYPRRCVVCGSSARR
jgi:hypothetical protein